jgi:hypothetical protein
MNATQDLKKLQKLSISFGSIQTASGIGIVPLKIDTLSIDGVKILYPLNPAYTPFVRSLRLSNLLSTSLLSIYPILPHINSLFLAASASSHQTHTLLEQSTSLETLSIDEWCIPRLCSFSLSIIKDRIKVLRIVVSRITVDHSSLLKIIEGSQAMNKLIIDGSGLESGSKLGYPINVLEVACAKKGMALWKENLVMNGNSKAIPYVHASRFSLLASHFDSVD